MRRGSTYRLSWASIEREHPVVYCHRKAKPSVSIVRSSLDQAGLAIFYRRYEGQMRIHQLSRYVELGSHVKQGIMDMLSDPGQR